MRNEYGNTALPDLCTSEQSLIIENQYMAQADSVYAFAYPFTAAEKQRGGDG
jgi:hypothetical protein